MENGNNILKSCPYKDITIFVIIVEKMGKKTIFFKISEKERYMEKVVKVFSAGNDR